MSKCGRKVSSITAINFSLSFFSSAWWPSMALPRSSEMVWTICWGCWPCDAAGAAFWASTGAATIVPTARAMARES